MLVVFYCSEKGQAIAYGILRKGNLLHIAFDSGVTLSVTNAVAVAEKLHSKYLNRKITVIDFLCGSFGYGLLVDEAADMRDCGCSMEEIEKWIIENRKKVHHQFFCTGLKYYNRSGRISGAAAAVGAILNICPIMRLDDIGHIIIYDKVRGKRRAIEKTVQTMEKNEQNGTQYSGKC